MDDDVVQTADIGRTGEVGDVFHGVEGIVPGEIVTDNVVGQVGVDLHPVEENRVLAGVHNHGVSAHLHGKGVRVGGLAVEMEVVEAHLVAYSEKRQVDGGAVIHVVGADVDIDRGVGRDDHVGEEELGDGARVVGAGVELDVVRRGGLCSSHLLPVPVNIGNQRREEVVDKALQRVFDTCDGVGGFVGDVCDVRQEQVLVNLVAVDGRQPQPVVGEAVILEVELDVVAADKSVAVV